MWEQYVGEFLQKDVWNVKAGQRDWLDTNESMNEIKLNPYDRICTRFPLTEKAHYKLLSV